MQGPSYNIGCSKSKCFHITRRATHMTFMYDSLPTLLAEGAEIQEFKNVFLLKWWYNFENFYFVIQGK